MTQRWHVRSQAINEVVQADDQWGAWDTLSGRPLRDFGMIVVAEPDESGDPYPVQTAMLLRRWGRDDEAAVVEGLAKALGLS